MIDFPDPRKHRFVEYARVDDYFVDARDIVCFGGELTPENVRRAYRLGVFPWTIDGLPLPWFCPEWRTILEFDRLHVPRSLDKAARKNQFTFTIDRDFARVIENCAVVKRENQSGETWISDEFIETYTALHETGDAHSVEAWDAASGELVGGVYGVDAGGAFCGESMFHLRPNASKLALLFLVEHLQSRGAKWLDAQVMTPHLAAFGAREIARPDFLELLDKTLAQNLRLF